MKEKQWVKHCNDNTLLVLSAASGSISIASVATFKCAEVEIPSASFSLVFSISNRIVKKLLKTMRQKKKKHNIILLARSKLNNIKNIIFKLLSDAEITHEEFTTIKNEGKCIRN